MRATLKTGVLCCAVALAASSGFGADTRGVLSEPELMELLAERFSSQPVKTNGDSADSWTETRASTFVGSFELETSLQWNPKVNVRYRVPMTLQKKPVPTADHMVMLCVWYGAAAPPVMKTKDEIIAKLPKAINENPKRQEEAVAKVEAEQRKRAEQNPDMQGRMAPFSDGLGFTTFSLEIVTHKDDFGNTREAYFHGGPEWVDVVRRARAEIMKRHRLKDRKLMLFGEVGMPPLGRPKGAVMFSHRYGFTDLPQLLDNLNFLAEQGYVVLAPRMRGESEPALGACLSFVERNRTLGSLPLAFIGIGEENGALWKTLLIHRTVRPAALVPIDFKSDELLDPAKWPLGGRVQWPVLFVYNQKDFAKVNTPEAAAQAAAKLQGVQNFLTLMQSRNQVAAVRFVPLKVKSDEKAAQKSVETALQFIDAAVGGNIRRQYK